MNVVAIGFALPKGKHFTDNAIEQDNDVVGPQLSAREYAMLGPKILDPAERQRVGPCQNELAEYTETTTHIRALLINDIAKNSVLHVSEDMERGSLASLMLSFCDKA